MRVLVLSSVFPSRTRPAYGVFVRERVRHVARRCDVVVVAPIPWSPFNRWVRGEGLANTPFREVQDGITVYYPRFPCLPLFGKSLDALFAVLGLTLFILWLKRWFPFDLIDAHFTYPHGAAGGLLGKIFRRAVVITVRGTHDIYHAGFALRRWQIRYALRTATRLIAVSDSLREFASDLGIDRRRVRVIPNGVDTAWFRPADRGLARRRLGLPEGRLILLGVGAFTEGKGHRRVIELVPDLIVRRPEVLYVALGADRHGDDYRQELETLIRHHGLQDHIRLIGPRPHHEIPVWMAAADLFCLATRSEGCCNAILEALACGLPVVTTDVGGNSELVAEGRDGLLVPFWDAKGFAAALLRALEIRWDRDGIAAGARANGWARAADAVLEEFALALDTAHAPLKPGGRS